ncbi:U2 small nuclear ribonucleoprotein A'-like [Triticum aestivum]|uniref:U2 small nuclear ribonucleoprotein A'-like n=1 Tax=Triticum aestivum TaxID=4565 RepID=UPI001D01052F|nr:U2 small nuclear ribonucleoprotein A'-like [Triticum aestivum]
MSSVEEFGGTEDEFDTIDLSENMIIKLGNVPCLNRLGTLVASHNRINHICSNIGELLPNLHTLVLMNNDITSLAEIDPLAALPKLKSLYLLENPVTEKPDYRFYVIHGLKHLMSLDFEKVKPQERTTAAHKFHSKEAQEEVKKTFAKAYTPMKPVGAQYITEKSCPKAVSPTTLWLTALKAAILSYQTLKEIGKIKTVLSTGQMAAEFASFKPDIDMAEALEKTDKIKGQNHENRADEQMPDEESTLIQELGICLDIVSYSRCIMLEIAGEDGLTPASERTYDISVNPISYCILQRRPDYGLQASKYRTIEEFDLAIRLRMSY